MDKIIANNEFNELPGIHFKNAPIENILNRRNNPTKGFIDRNFRYRDLNKPPGLDDNTSNFPSISHLINKITRPGANLSFAGYPSGAASRGGLYATEVANMQKLADMGRLTSGGKDWVSGKNVVSGFGDYNKGMQKNLERFEQTAEDKGFKDLDELEAYYKAQYGPIKNNAVLQRLKHAQQMTGGNNWINKTDGTDGGSFKTRDKNYGFDNSGNFIGEGPGPDFHSGQTSYVDGQTTDWGPSSHMIAEGGLAQHAPIRPYSLGGRVGYNEGGRVGILSVF
jgi:hypothetical protein